MGELDVKLGGTQTCPECGTLQVTGLTLPKECPECLTLKKDAVSNVLYSDGLDKPDIKSILQYLRWLHARGYLICLLNDDNNVILAEPEDVIKEAHEFCKLCRFD